jgi:hypothetical protein
MGATASPPETPLAPTPALPQRGRELKPAPRLSMPPAFHAPNSRIKSQ